MLKNTSFFLLLITSSLFFNSCKKDYESIQSIDEAKIQAYIKKNNITATKDPSGFYFQIVDGGSGDVMTNKDSVFYDFDIKSFDGTVYQGTKSYNNLGTYLGYITPTPFRIALLGLKRGAEVKLIIPSYLAFGKNGNGNIPSNEVILSTIKTLPQKTQWEIDDKRIVDFLASKNITNAVKHSSRVYYQVLTPGSGTAVIDQHSALVMKYSGRFLDGTQFDAGDSFSTTLNGVVPGWGKVIPLFSSGAKIRIFVPSDLAYGPSGYGSIPANCVLDFTIEIVSVTN